MRQRIADTWMASRGPQNVSKSSDEKILLHVHPFVIEKRLSHKFIRRPRRLQLIEPIRQYLHAFDNLDFNSETKAL